MVVVVPENKSLRFVPDEIRDIISILLCTWNQS